MSKEGKELTAGKENGVTGELLCCIARQSGKASLEIIFKMRTDNV